MEEKKISIVEKNGVIVLRNVRCTFPVLDAPKAVTKVLPGENPVRAYSIGVLIPKEEKEVIEELKRIYRNVLANSKLNPGKKDLALKTAENMDVLNKMRLIKDGDELNAYYEMTGKRVYPYMNGHFIVAPRLPESWEGHPLYIVDRRGQLIPKPDIKNMILPGYYVNLSFYPYPYDSEKGFGLTFRLQGVQFVQEAEVFGMSNPFDALDPEETETEVSVFDPGVFE